jgi:hypothetical protein
MSETATEAGEGVDRVKLDKRRIAMALCDILHDYIPKACKRDAEEHMSEFFIDRKIRIVIDE